MVLQVLSGRHAPRPNLKSVTNILKKIFAGFQRLTGTEISDEFRKDIRLVSVTRRRYAERVAALIGLPPVCSQHSNQTYTTTKKREKRLLDVDDLQTIHFKHGPGVRML